MKTENAKIVLALSVFFAAAVFVLALCSGTVYVSPAGIFSALLGDGGGAENVIILQLRLPRICAAAITGASLALSGCALQSVFRNPLAEPSITGVSSGAALGAVVAIMFFSGEASLQISAFCFALLASLAVFKIGTEAGRINPTSTLLAGIAVNALCAAGIGLFMYATRESGLKSFVFWSLGSFERCDWVSVGICFAVSLPMWIVTLMQAKNLNAMMLGDSQAFNVGVNVQRVRAVVMLASVATTAASVAICGIIGFVGLIIPHVARILCGPDNRRCMPVAVALGAALVVAADAFAHAAAPFDPVPIGVITAILGAPFFVYVLKRRRNDA